MLLAKLPLVTCPCCVWIFGGAAMLFVSYALLGLICCWIYKRRDSNQNDQ